MKKCPFCAEEIQSEAIKCRFCGSVVVQANREKWYYRISTLTWAFLILGPLWLIFLPFVWMNPDADLKRKSITTAVMLFLTWALVQSLAYALSFVKQYYSFVLPQ